MFFSVISAVSAVPLFSSFFIRIFTELAWPANPSSSAIASMSTCPPLSVNWGGFQKYLGTYTLPKRRIHHNMYNFPLKCAIMKSRMREFFMSRLTFFEEEEQMLTLLLDFTLFPHFFVSSVNCGALYQEADEGGTSPKYHSKNPDPYFLFPVWI